LRRIVLAQTSAIFGLAIASMVVVLNYDVKTISPTALGIVALVTFAAVVAAAMLIAWAGEASQFSVSQGLALAVVALVQTLPEFFVEGGIAWLAGQDPTKIDLVIANFTGANRLLSGLGWPLILFIVQFQRRRNGHEGSGIALRPEHSIEVVFMLGASFYYILIIWKGTLTLVDSLIMGSVFFVYLAMLSKLPSEEEDPNEVLGPVPLTLVKIPSMRARGGAIISLFLFSGLVFVIIVQPFVLSMERIATLLFGGVLAVFFFIQWVAPFLSEFPEKVSAFHWARTIKLAPLALLNFVSSSVNELTILIAIIPIVFSISSGLILPVPVAAHSGEILLTMAQSFYACASLLSLRYGLRNALTLFSLWLISTLIPIFAYNNPAVLVGRDVISVAFLVLAGVEVFLHRGKITVFREFRQTVKEYVRGRGPRANGPSSAASKAQVI